MDGSVVRVFHERDVSEPVLELGGKVMETRIIRGKRGAKDNYIHLIQMSERSRMRFDREMKCGGCHWIYVESMHADATTSAPTHAAAPSVSTHGGSLAVTDLAPTPQPASAAPSAAPSVAPSVAPAKSDPRAAESSSEWQPATVTWNGKPAKGLVMRVPDSMPVMYHVRWKQGRYGFYESSEAVCEADVTF